MVGVGEVRYCVSRRFFLGVVDVSLECIVW